MLISIVTGLLLATAPTQAATPAVVAGKADWASFPALDRTPRPLPTGAMVDRVADMLERNECSLPGQSFRRFDITIPYLALVKPDGSVERVVVADMGCPSLEAYAGSLVLQLAGSGDFRPTGRSAPHWYASKLNFNVR